MGVKFIMSDSANYLAHMQNLKEGEEMSNPLMANPYVAGGMIGAGVLSDIFSNIAARDRQEREAKVKGAQAAGQMESQAIGQAGSGQQNALAQLMGAYRNSLIR
jgi:hypothetical protein